MYGLSESKYLVVAVMPANDVPFYKAGHQPATHVRVSVAADPANLFSQWRERYEAFVPVAVFRLDGADVEKVLGIKVPSVMSLQEGARLFGRLPVEGRFAQAVFSTIRQLRELGVSLLSEWFNAVAASKAAAGITQSE